MLNPILKQFTASNRTWLLQNVTDTNLQPYIQAFPNVSYSLLYFLASRNISINSVPDFLNPSLKTTMPNPTNLVDMQKAVDRVFQAITNKENIALLADYDVDGATSVASIYNFLDSINVNPIIYVPNRHNEGYGVNIDAINKLKQSNVNLLILLDNGTNALASINHANSLGMDVIILDHHEVSVNLPEAFAFVNPKRLDDSSNQTHLATVGIAFLFIVALNKTLKNSGYNPADPLSILDLTALGTICDMVPLIGVNRAFVNKGLQVMQKMNNLGLKALFQISGGNFEITTNTLGYTFGPLLNAGSRLGDSDSAATLLIEKNYNNCLKISKNLKELNEERKKIEHNLIQHATSLHENELQTLNQNQIIFVGGENYDKGVVGLVASKLKDIFQMPACVYSLTNNIATASLRSTNNVDVGEITLEALNENLIIKGGGHKMAAGLTFNIENKTKLINFFNTKIKDKFNNATIPIVIDSPLQISFINESFINNFNSMNPFGTYFEEPIFLISNVKVSFFKWVGASLNHLYLVLKDDSNNSLKAFCYKCQNTNLASFLTEPNARVSVAVNLKIDKFNNKTNIHGVIIDVAKD